MAGAAGAGAGSVTWVGLRPGGPLPEPRAPLHVLDATGFGVLALLAGRILRGHGADPIEVAHQVDASLRYATPEAQGDTRMILGVLENALAGIFTRGQVEPFSRLAPQEKDAAIARWGDSRFGILRGAMGGLRKLCLASHYASLDAQKALGYPGPPIEPPSPAPIEARAPLTSDTARIFSPPRTEPGPVFLEAHREGAP